MDSFQGEAAQGMKNYLEEAHLVILLALSEVLLEISNRYRVYQDGYFQIDSNHRAQLCEDTIHALWQYFNTTQSDFENANQNIRNAINSIRGLAVLLPPNAWPITANYEQMATSTITSGIRSAASPMNAMGLGALLQPHLGFANMFSSVLGNRGKLNGLISAVTNYENERHSRDFVQLDEMISSLERIINRFLNMDNHTKNAYQRGMVGELDEFSDLLNAILAAEAERADIDWGALAEREQQWIDDLEAELAEQRRREATWNLITNVAMITLGVLVIVGTLGKATPLVVAAVVIANVPTVSNVVENVHDIYLGATGQGFAASFNPIRDTIFQGNQQHYNWFSMACGIVALCLGGINAGVQSVQSGASATTGVLTYSRNVALVGGAGMTANAGTRELLTLAGVDPITANGIGRVAGVGTSFGTSRAINTHARRTGAGGVDRLDQRHVRDPRFLNERGGINWPQHDGFVLDAQGNPIKHSITPQRGMTFDRLGSADGRFVSPTRGNGQPASFESRSLPYRHIPETSHRYVVTRNFSELPSAVRNSTDPAIIRAVNNHWGGNANNITAFHGRTAPAFGQPGGGEQIALPFSVEQLQQLGFISDITVGTFDPSLFPAVSVAAGSGSAPNPPSAPANPIPTSNPLTSDILQNMFGIGR